MQPIEVQGSERDFTKYQVVDRVVSDDSEPGTIVEVVRKGFYFGDKVFRPAQVVVPKRDRRSFNVEGASENQIHCSSIYLFYAPFLTFCSQATLVFMY